MSDSTFIGSDLKLRGLLDAHFQHVVIAGQFEGEIKADKLHILAGAKCEAIIEAKQAIIEGDFAGIIHCDDLVISESASVGGELTTDALTIDSGADVSGKIIRKAPKPAQKAY